jgi:hypothetical protein
MKTHEVIHKIIYNQEKKINCINSKIYLNVVGALDDKSESQIDYLFSLIKSEIKKIIKTKKQGGIL